MLDQKLNICYSRQVVSHISEVKMHVDYGPSIGSTSELLKTALIVFLLRILSFIMLKPKVFLSLPVIDHGPDRANAVVQRLFDRSHLRP